ncbi:MAG: DUF4340 domain-containing protein [Ruminococcus sp.]|nr:DUF4340 domain-containing protein [Ruminococcus sp.]
MKKQLILILSLILLVGVTAGILLLVSNIEADKKAEAERAEQEKVLVSLYSNDIDKIEIISGDDTYIASLNENGQWVLENEVDFEINTYYLNSVASQLSTLTAEEVIGPADEESLSKYELDEPNTTITLYSGDTPHTIHVGRLSATEEFYYVTMEGRDKIFAVSADYADYLTANKNSLKSIYILRNSDSQVTDISLKAHGEMVYELSMDESLSWNLLHPVTLKERVDSAGVNLLLTTINQMIVDRFGDEYVTEDQYAEYGFEDPEYIFSFKQENGETTTLLVQDYDTASTDYVCCICKETGQIFYMEATYTDFLQEDASAFVQDTVYSCPIGEIESISIQWNERENAELFIDDENSVYELNGTNVKEANPEAVTAVENFYTKIQALKYDAMIPENPVPDNAEMEISITYTKMDGTETVVSFAESDADNYAVFVNGEYSYFTVSKKNFTARDGIYDYFDQLMDAAGLDE